MKILKFSTAVVSVLLLSAVQYSSCEKFNIVPSPDSPCPGEFTGEPCITLQQYVANPSLSSQSITFELHPGNHSLNSQLRLSNINSFVLRATASTTVTCNLDEPFYFNQLQQIHVSGITFVGCRMYLGSITNATFERNSFVNRTGCCLSGAALHVRYSSVTIRLCIISNNRRHNGGTIYGYQSTLLIEQVTFSRNSYGGAIYISSGSIDIRKSNFSSNSANPDLGQGGAIYNDGGVVNIIGTNFSGNRAGMRGRGGAIYTRGRTTVTITDCTFTDSRAGITGGAVYTTNGPGIMNITGSYFSDNSARSHGGTVYFDGGNITITNSSLINNTANTGGGGAIYSARRYTNISLVNNIFSHNTAAHCGVMSVAEFYHYVDIIGNTFTYNRAVQKISSNNGGGVICVRNASMLVIDNIFSQNSAAGNAGVMQVDESDIIIERSMFSNNTAGENGGVLHTFFYPTRYTIIDSSFTNNQAGGDGGVMYVGRAGSHVTISQSTFGFNNATNRGGVIAILGSTLEIDGADIFENTAELGEVISACNSDVTVTNPEFLASQDPIYSFCTLYNGSNTTISRTTEQATPTTDITTDTTMTAASTTAESDTLTTTLSPTDDVITISIHEVASITLTVESTASPQTIPPEASTKPESSTAVPITTRPVVSPASDESQDTADYTLRYILPSYVSIGVSTVLLVVVAFIGLFVIVIAVKVFRVKTKSQNINLSAHEHPKINDEYSLLDVHVAHT